MAHAAGQVLAVAGRHAVAARDAGRVLQQHLRYMRYKTARDRQLVSAMRTCSNSKGCLALGWDPGCPAHAHAGHAPFCSGSIDTSASCAQQRRACLGRGPHQQQLRHMRAARHQAPQAFLCAAASTHAGASAIRAPLLVCGAAGSRPAQQLEQVRGPAALAGCLGGTGIVQQVGATLHRHLHTRAGPGGHPSGAGGKEGQPVLLAAAQRARVGRRRAGTARSQQPDPSWQPF